MFLLSADCMNEKLVFVKILIAAEIESKNDKNKRSKVHEAAKGEKEERKKWEERSVIEMLRI